MGHFLIYLSLKVVSIHPIYATCPYYVSENYPKNHTVGIWNDTDLARVLSPFPSTEHVGRNAGRAVLGLAALLKAQNGHLHFVNQCWQRTSFRRSAPPDNSTNTTRRVGA
jgi:hypothetical protein